MPLRDEALPEGLVDYKVMCYGGQSRYVFTCADRAKHDLRVDFFDLDWNHLPFTRNHPNADVIPPAPVHLNEMLNMAEKLAGDFPFVRVDFYEAYGKLYFGELTFYPGAGFEAFDPKEWDYVLGSDIELREYKG